MARGGIAGTRSGPSARTVSGHEIFGLQKEMVLSRPLWSFPVLPVLSLWYSGWLALREVPEGGHRQAMERALHQSQNQEGLS